MTPAERTALRSLIEKEMKGAGTYYTPGNVNPIAPVSSASVPAGQSGSSTEFNDTETRQLNLQIIESQRRDAAEQKQQLQEFKQVMDSLHAQRRAAARKRLDALRARIAQERAMEQQAQSAWDTAKEDNVQHDWGNAIEENVQFDWAKAIPEDAVRGQYNPITAFAASPASHLISRALPYGMRDNARRVLGLAGEAYGALPFSRRRQIHQLGAKAAGVFGKFAPQQYSGAIGNIGAQFGFEEAASMGIAGGVIAGGALAIGGSNISSMAGSGHEIVSNLVGGIHSAMGDVVSAGKAIGSVLAGSALSPFGKSGSAVGNLAGSVLGGAASLGGSAMGGISSIAGGIGGAVGGAAGAGLGIVGAVGGGLVGGPMGAAIGGVVMTTLGMLVGKVLSSITGMFGGILKAAGAMAGELGKVIASGIKAAIDVITDTLQALMSFAGNMQSIWMNSGLSTRTAAGALMNSQALGMSAQDATGMFSGNALFQRGRQAIIGATGAPGSAEFFTSAQRRYQQLLKQAGGNPMMANQIFQTAGYGAMIPAMNMSPGLTNYALNTSSQMQQAFGLDPEKIKEAGQQMSVLNGLFGQFVELVKMKFAQELFPFLSNVFKKLIDYVGENSGKIADGIKTGVTWAITEFPKMLADFAASVLRVTAGITDSIGGFLINAGTWLPLIGKIFKILGNEVKGFITMVDILRPHSVAEGLNPAWYAVQSGKRAFDRRDDIANFVKGRFDFSPPEWAINTGNALTNAGKYLQNDAAPGQLRMAANIENFGKEWKETADGFMSSIDSLSKTIAGGLDVNVTTEYTLSPTDNFLAEATAKASWVKWRKMSQAVG